MLEFRGHIDLPQHNGKGGFDHADVDPATGRVFVAHTANDALDVFDGVAGRYLYSVPGLKGIAGALVAGGQVFTSNRRENTASIFRLDAREAGPKVPVGIRPNGLAFAPDTNLLLSAHVGDAERKEGYSVAIIDVAARRMTTLLGLAGRTRWTVYDEQAGEFFVNIADPPEISVIAARLDTEILRTIAIPCAGPHGLALSAGALYCACDGGKLIRASAKYGKVTGELPLSGVPDVIWLHAPTKLLFVSIGDPGVIDVFDIAAWRKVATVATEGGAHTSALDVSRRRLYALLPASHCASIFEF